MKKVIIILAALAGLTFTSCTSDEDNLYSVSVSVCEESYIGSSNTDARTVYKEFEQAIVAFDTKYAKERSGWVVTIHNGKTKKADANAMATYTPMEKELENLFDTYQTKLFKCSGNCTLTYVAEIKLKRHTADGAFELNSHKFSLSYPQK